MKFNMAVRDLIDGLNNVTRALAVRPVKPILEGVLVEANDNTVTISCTNGSLTIESTLVAEIEEPGRMVLPGRIFADIIRKLPEENVTIAGMENGSVRIRCGRFKASLAGMNPLEFPEMSEIIGGVTVDVPQNVLKEMIGGVVFAIAVDESKPVLTGCLMEISSEGLRLVALDGYRLAIRSSRMEIPLPAEQRYNIIVPGKVMSEISKMILDEEEPCRLIFDKTRMECSFGNTRLSTVLLSGEYIDYRRILPRDFKSVAKANRAALTEAIDRACLMAREGKSNLIKLSFAEDRLLVKSNAEMGDITEDTEILLEGDPLDIAFNAKYLSELIRYVQEEELCMHLNSNVSPCVFKPQDDERYLYLLLPVRVFQ